MLARTQLRALFGELLHRVPDLRTGEPVQLVGNFVDGVKSMTATGRPELRVLLLTGEGKNFCAGGDVKTFAAKGEALPDYLREATAWLQNVAAALLALPVPVVAAVHGFAAGGGGLGLVCASDIVLAGESARFMVVSFDVVRGESCAGRGVSRAGTGRASRRSARRTRTCSRCTR